jgi:pyrimidine-nucleoside phosphorylase
MAIVGQTANLAPADKKIYALRDVTATVDNISLIASSIMSKKIASGSDVIVLDVKTGSGAFMKSFVDSLALAKEMVQIGTIAGRKTYAVITDMNQPLGSAVGNTLEVIEAIDTLKGEGPKDLLEVSITLAAFMLMGAGKADSLDVAKEMLYKTIEDKSALNKLAEFISAQGGNSDAVYNTELLQRANIEEILAAPSDGYITSIQTEEVGMTSLILGGGRETKESVIDLSVGIKIHKKLGDYVQKGDALATLYANDSKKLEEAKDRLLKAYIIGNEKPTGIKHVYAIVTKDGVKMMD